MDAVQSPTAILPVSTATANLSVSLSKLRGSGEELEELRKKLTSLCSTLSLLEKVERSLQRSPQIWHNALRILGGDDGRLSQTSQAMAELSTKVERLQRHRMPSSLAARLFKGKSKEAQAKIDDLLEVIRTDFHLDALTAMTEPALLSAMDSDGQTLQQALNWVSNSTSTTQQTRFKSFIGKDAGQWFINDPQFHGWLHGGSGQILLCPGAPEAGRTVMVAGVVDYLQANIRSLGESANLVCIYCDYKTEETLETLLGEMIRQLVQHNNSLALPLLALHDRYVQHKILPTTEDMYSALECILLRQPAATILIDAMDEIPQEHGIRRRFADMLVRLKTKVGSMRLLVTCRPLPDITEAFENVPTLEIKAAEDDIRWYIDRQFEHLRVSIGAAGLQKAQAFILQTCNNTFLLARLLTELFTSMQTQRQIDTLLEDLSTELKTPSGPADLYTKVYQATLSRIEAQTPQDRDLARRAIMWITNSCRPLRTNELRCALSVEPEKNAALDDEDNWPLLENIVSVCAGLVVVDKERDLVQLVHHTAQEHLDDYQKGRTKEMQQALAATCLTYLCLEQGASGPDENGEYGNDTSAEDADSAPFQMMPAWVAHHQREWAFLESGSDPATNHDVIDTSRHSSQVCSVDIPPVPPSAANQTIGLTDYAANFWASHARSHQPDLLQPALRLLRNQRLAARAFQSATSLHQPWEYLHFPPGATSTKITGLHLAAALGLTHVCEALFETIGRTPGIHADARDDGRRTALMWAAHHDHEDTVRLLLARADVDCEKVCRRGETALHYAARRGWTSIAQLLLDAGGGGYARTMMMSPEALCRRRNVFEEPAIVRAALEGHRDMVQLLSKWDSQSLHQQVLFGQFPIHLAAKRCPASTVRLLVEEYGVDVDDVEDPKGHTPFVAAVDWGNEDVVRYFVEERMEHLMRHGAVQLAKAVHLAAASWKRLNILQLLVEKASFVVGFLDANGKTPLEVAVEEGNTQAVIYLTEFSQPKIWTSGPFDVPRVIE